MKWRPSGAETRQGYGSERKQGHLFMNLNLLSDQYFSSESARGIKQERKTADDGGNNVGSGRFRRHQSDPSAHCCVSIRITNGCKLQTEQLKICRFYSPRLIFVCFRSVLGEFLASCDLFKEAAGVETSADKRPHHKRCILITCFSSLFLEP